LADIEKQGIMLYDAETVPLAKRRILTPAEIKPSHRQTLINGTAEQLNFLKAQNFTAQENNTSMQPSCCIKQKKEATKPSSKYMQVTRAKLITKDTIIKNKDSS